MLILGPAEGSSCFWTPYHVWAVAAARLCAAVPCDEPCCMQFLHADHMHLTPVFRWDPQCCPEFRAKLMFGSARLSFSYWKLVLILFAHVWLWLACITRAQKELRQSWCNWLVSCKAYRCELLSLLPISMMQVSPRAQGQKKDQKLSDTKVISLQGELNVQLVDLEKRIQEGAQELSHGSSCGVSSLTHKGLGREQSS